MPAAALDPCVTPINPACIAQQVAGTVQTSASAYLLGGLGRAFIESAAQVARASYGSLDQTTGIDLTASWFWGNVTVIAAVIAEERKRHAAGRVDHQIPMRPDHGQDIVDDLTRRPQPGYPTI